MLSVAVFLAPLQHHHVKTNSDSIDRTKLGAYTERHKKQVKEQSHFFMEQIYKEKSL